MVDLTKLETEKSNSESRNFSSMSIKESIELMNKQDFQAVECIKPAIGVIESLIKKTSSVLSNGGRIIYIGAGTSGRLGVIDSAECPPTFGVDNNTVIALMAGGNKSIFQAKEGAEDSIETGREQLVKINLNRDDILIGISASGRTPYVISALKYAKEIGCEIGAIVCNFNSEISRICDTTVEVVPGPEVLAGSTRLKAGTATKLVLNMISTISMKNIGKIYKNYMVDLKISNEKLKSRAINIIKDVTNRSDEYASNILNKANGDVKATIVMILLNCSYQEALKKLDSANQDIDVIEKRTSNQ